MPSISQVPTVAPPFQKAVSRWLLLCLLLIGFMVIIGGYTRLSGSGLSITEWKPIHGTIPPLNMEQWQEEFTKYQAIPQYQQVNKGMSLSEFKAIYWPEFWHRNLGRLIGLIFALPLFYFIYRRAFSPAFTLRLIAILMLGGAQGLIGWIMVASGLQDRIYVHHLKLSIHFGMAMLLASAIWWSLLDVISGRRGLYNIIFHPACGGDKRGGFLRHKGRTELTQPAPPQPPPQAGGEDNSTPQAGWESKNTPPAVGSYLFLFITLLIFTQLVMGAMVAGLHAGLVYNTFPLMNGDWVAPDVLTYQGSWFDHAPLIQFIHRWLAKLIVILVALWWWLYQRPGAGRDHIAIKLFFAMLLLQFTLGVLTLINAVPITYALLHQIGGVLLLLAALAVLHAVKKADNKSVQPG